jgi:hypothetical protein
MLDLKLLGLGRSTEHVYIPFDALSETDKWQQLWENKKTLVKSNNNQN